VVISGRGVGSVSDWGGDEKGLIESNACREGVNSGR